MTKAVIDPDRVCARSAHRNSWWLEPLADTPSTSTCTKGSRACRKILTRYILV